MPLGHFEIAKMPFIKNSLKISYYLDHHQCLNLEKYRLLLFIYHII